MSTALQAYFWVTALHSHMLEEQPRLHFMHFWASDDAMKLAKGLRTALDQDQFRQTEVSRSKPSIPQANCTAFALARLQLFPGRDCHHLRCPLFSCLINANSRLLGPSVWNGEVKPVQIRHKQ
jgi:hypothetical protein